MQYLFTSWSRLSLAMLFVSLIGTNASPHAQRFEDDDATYENPVTVEDCQISYAWYGSISFPGDVDYFSFEGTQGEEVILYLLFPVIEGALEFYPSMALIGPGLPEANLPGQIVVPEGSGALPLEYSLNQLDEMAHGRVYKYPLPMELALPENGTYNVVFWHDDSSMGRYCFSHGSSHDAGVSDPDAETKIEEFWTPLTMSINIGSGAAPLKMVRIPKGVFTMGSAGTEDGRNEDELQHQVTVSNSFYIGQFEITQEQWETVMGLNPSHFTEDTNLPVENVSWNACQTFVETLNGLPGIDGTFRLPTEAEWEYACRAESTTRFCWGDDANLQDIESHAWCNLNSEEKTHVTGQKQSNPWGVFDMSGNVGEWCSDWYGGYTSNEPVDPQGPAEGSARVVRGGSWQCDASSGRSASRAGYPETEEMNTIGLRVVLELPGTSSAIHWPLYE